MSIWKIGEKTNLNVEWNSVKLFRKKIEVKKEQKYLFVALSIN